MKTNCPKCQNTVDHSEIGDGLYECTSCGASHTGREIAVHLERILVQCEPTYTLTHADHAAWHSGDQRKHDDLHGLLRERLALGTEILDADGVVVDAIGE